MRKFLTVILWALGSMAVLGLVTLPISLDTQLIAGLSVLIAMMILKLVRPDGIWRLIALAFGTAIVMRYVYWRTTSTLPPLNQPENFIPGFLLYLAELYSVMMLALSLFVVAQPLPPRPSRANSNDRHPTVDVFIPTYNEEPELLANTMAAAKGMDYPQDRVTIWLLDDGGTVQKRNSEKIADANKAERRHAELRKLAEDLGVRYLTRER
ncbi:MAG: glycosyltransferase, partial [Mesorhizobium sp.]|nr:glycosyltransferase [Mesorhizobium sp.]